MRSTEDKIAISVFFLSILMLGYGIWAELFNNGASNTPGASFAYYNWHTPAILSLIYFFVRYKFAPSNHDVSPEL